MVEFKVLFLILALAGTLAADARAEIRDVIAKIKPSVVIVGSFKSTDSPRFRLRGTGFIVGNGNTVVTNAHVLPSDSENMTDTSLVVQVRISDRELQMRQAEVLEVDKVHDLALLRFQGAAAPAVPIRDSDSVREGQPVAFMGFPIGGALGVFSRHPPRNDFFDRAVCDAHAQRTPAQRKYDPGCPCRCL